MVVAGIGAAWTGLCAVVCIGWSIFMRGLRDAHERALERAGLLDDPPGDRPDRENANPRVLVWTPQAGRNCNGRR